MRRLSLSLIFVIVLIPAMVFAHFVFVHPSDNMIFDREKSEVTLDVSFGHHFSQSLIDMEKPVRFGVLADGKKTDLLNTLKEMKVKNKRTYVAKYKIKRPGDHVFFVQDKPYWEPAIGKFLAHYSKTVVHTFGLQEGWDKMVGSPIEIRPLTRPYGLWTGNVFQGQVIWNGKPLPGAKVKITYNNEGLALKTYPKPYRIQIIHADENGVFTYAMPRAGWWGFLALTEDGEKIKGSDGQMKPVLTIGLIWVKVEDMK